jgi:hypothetical protein
MALQVRCSILKPLIIKIINVFMEGISHWN